MLMKYFQMFLGAIALFQINPYSGHYELFQWQFLLFGQDVPILKHILHHRLQRCINSIITVLGRCVHPVEVNL